MRKVRIPKLNDQNNKLICKAARDITRLKSSKDRMEYSLRLVGLISTLQDIPNSTYWMTASDDLGYLMQGLERALGPYGTGGIE